MIVFSRLCTLIVVGKIVFEAVFIVLTMLGVLEHNATGGAATLGVVAGFAAMVLLEGAQARHDNETSRDGIKLGIDYARAEAKDDPALIDGLGV